MLSWSARCCASRTRARSQRPGTTRDRRCAASGPACPLRREWPAPSRAPAASGARTASVARGPRAVADRRFRCASRQSRAASWAKKESGRRGTSRSNRLELDLAGVLPRLRLVGGRRAVDVEQILDPGHARHFHYGFLDVGDLERVIDLAADRDHSGLDVDVDPALRQVGIAKDLTLDPVPQRQVVGGAWARSQAHHFLRKGGGTRTGPRSDAVEGVAAGTKPGTRPIEELLPARASLLRDE